MKKFLTNVLPMMAAAVLLATSCSKDNDSENNVVNNPTAGDDVHIVSTTSETPTIPFSITVGKSSNSLSKATVDASTLTQTFETGDQLVISGTDISGTLTLKSGDEGKSTGATFEGELSGDGVASITDATPLTATLTNATNGNEGKELSDVQFAKSLAEAFQKYGYWTSSFKYGERNNVELVENTVFLRVKPFYGENKATINGTSYDVQSDGTIYLAVKSGTTLTSNLFSGSKTVTNENDKVVKNIDRSDVLPSLFSVAVDKQIRFSKGNLQYKASSKDWRFAENQWDYIGSDNKNISETYDGYIDLFGWGMWLDGQNPTNTSGNSEDYLPSVTAGEFSGSSAIGSQWQTLKYEEWKYLVNATTHGYGYIHGVFGLILLPDGYTTPDGISQSFIVYNSSGYPDATYSDEDWSKMESAGAVFLPAAGDRSETTINNTNSKGWYWLARGSQLDVPTAMETDFVKKGYFRPYNSLKRSYGFSVRLVRSVD